MQNNENIKFINEFIEYIPYVVLSIEYPSGNILYYNQKALKNFGLPIDIPKNIKAFAKFLLKEYRKDYFNFWRNISKNILQESLEYKIKLTNDTTKWVGQTNIFIKSNNSVKRTYFILQDITDKKNLEDEINQTYYFAENLFLHSPYIIVLFNNHGSIIRYNIKYGKFAQSIDKFPENYNIFKDKQVQKYGIDLILKEVLKGKIKEIPEFPYTLKIDKKKVSYYFRGISFPFKGPLNKVEGIVLMLEDITSKREIEQEYLEAKRLESVGRIARGIAHEFNNILAGISGFSEILMRKLSQDDPTYKFAKKIFEAASKAVTLTNQLSGFARGSLYNPTYIDIRTPIMYAIGATPGLTPKIKITKNFEEKDYYVYGDKNQLRQIFIEILKNSIEAMDGSGEIFINVVYTDYKDIQFYIQKQYAKCVKIEIEDTGTGINNNVKDKIFDPYFTTKDPSKHSGMGLAIVYGHLKNHEGSIKIENTKKGTKTTIILPAIKKPPELKITEKYQRILVIDDNDETCLLLRSYFEEKGSFVRIYNHGYKAVEAIKKTSYKFDCIFLDLILPDINGKELLNIIRKFNPDTPVVIMSGYDLSTFINENKDDKNLHFISKPFNLDDLDLLLK